MDSQIFHRLVFLVRVQYHENKVIDYKGETEGKYEYSDDDRKQLSDLSVKEREGAAKTITVFVKTIGRKTISVSCDTKQQMKQIKMQVTRRKMPEKMLCLVSDGKIRKDENTIEDHTMKDKETIEACMSALGGMKDEESSASSTK